jgi:hypothetical protein
MSSVGHLVLLLLSLLLINHGWRWQQIHSSDANDMAVKMFAACATAPTKQQR